MGQLIVEEGVFGVQPFSIKDIACAQDGPERVRVRVSPALEQVKVLLPAPTGQEMASTLQPQSAVGVEGYAGVGTVQLFLNHQETAGELVESNAGRVLVARLETRALQMLRARVF